jgi:NitT/TauT family transport system permease protein
MSDLKEHQVAVEMKAALDAVEPGRTARSASASPAARRQLRIGIWLPPLIAFAIIALIWELYSHAHPFTIPSIEHIWGSLRENPHMYWANTLTTLREIAIGGLSGIGAAILLAIVMAEAPIVERALMPLTVVLMVTPIIAIAPALVVAFGFGVFPKYLVTAIVVFYPMLVNSLAGLRDVDARTLDVFTTLHANRWETFRRLRLPSSLPFLFAGLRIAVPLSVVGAVVAEIAAAGQQAGLGALISVAASQANLPIIWSSIVLLCVLGIVLLSVLALIRSRVLFWDNASSKRT